jgi:RimJ/RimL family protein N-acetyltransferase
MTKQGQSIQEGYAVTNCVAEGLSPAELATCVRIIKEGGAVNPQSPSRELPRATALAIVRKGNDIVGVGAIKRSRSDYACLIEENSGFSFNKSLPELGYVAVDQKHQGHGLSHLIVATLVSNCKEQLFATTDNIHMKRTLKKAGFRQQGREWEGNKGRLSLWITQ